MVYIGRVVGIGETETGRPLVVYDMSMLATRPEPGNRSRIERAFSH